MLSARPQIGVSCCAPRRICRFDAMRSGMTLVHPIVACGLLLLAPSSCGSSTSEGATDASATDAGASDASPEADSEAGHGAGSEASDDGGAPPGHDGGFEPESLGDAAVCLPFDGGLADCSNAPCPPGTLCSTETGSAGPPLYTMAWCIPIPPACATDPTCSCMGACACTHSAGSLPERCTMLADASVISCDNGLR